MGPWIDFHELRRRVTLEDVVFRFYGIDTLERAGDKLVGPCPVHGGDSPRSFHADLPKNQWFCFSRRHGGNQLDFVAQKEGIGVREAAIRLHEFFLGRESQGKNGTGPRPPHAPQKPQPRKRGSVQPNQDSDIEGDQAEPPVNEPLGVRLQLAGDHPHLTEVRKLRPETIAAFEVGYCSRGILRGTIAIPIHDEHGVLVAYAGRRLKAQAIREKGKYVLPRGFRKQLVLYNFHRAKDHIAEMGLVLVEGFFSTMKLHEAGYLNVVAAIGCDVSDAQADLLALSPEVTILFDGNDAGRLGAFAARDKLRSRTKVRLVNLPDGYEPEDLGPEDLRWLLGGVRGLDLTEIALVRPPKVQPSPDHLDEATAVELAISADDARKN